MATYNRYLITLFLFNIFSFYSQNLRSQAPDSLLAKANEYHDQGLASDEKGNPILAIKFYEQALNIRKQALSEYQDSTDEVLDGIIKGYFNIGYAWFLLMNYQKAEIYYDSCSRSLLNFTNQFEFTNSWRQVQLHHAYGQLCYEIAGMENALLAFNNTLLHLKLGSDIKENKKLKTIARISNDISALYIKWDVSPDSILRYAKDAITIYDRLLQQSPGDFLLLRELSKAKSNEAYGYEIKGKLDEAERSFKNAINGLENIKSMIKEDMKVYDEKDRGWHINQFGYTGKSLNQAHNGLAITLLRKNKYAEAREILVNSIAWNESLLKLNPAYGQSSILLAGDYHNLGDVYYAEGKFELALENYQTSIEYIINDFEKVKIQYENPDILIPDLYIIDDIYFLSSLTEKAKCFHKLNKSKAALATASLGIDYIYQIRKNYQDIHSRNRLADFMKAFTEVIIQIHLQSPDQGIEKAFYYAEKNKIFTLLEAVRDHKSLEVAGVDKNLLKEEKNLRRAIEKMNGALKEAQDAIQKKELFSQLLQKKEDLAEVLDKLSEQPNYQRLFVSAEPVNVAYIQKSLLAKDQAMLEYFIGRDSTYIFLLPKRGAVQYFTVSIPEEELIKEVDNFINAILHSAEVNRSSTVNINQTELEEQLLNTAYTLYRNFLLPIVATTNVKQLVIIPDGVFNKMPFSALVSSTSGVVPGAYHNYDFVGKQYAISYCYAATLLAEMQQPIWPKPTEVLAFAPSFQGGVSQYRMGLSRLRFNKLEVEKICEYLSCERGPYLAESAIKQTFMETVSQQPYYMLHLSTHGKADYSDPNNSYIAFSQLNEHEIDEKQFLFLRELYNMEIAVETVVLSSCETNLGPIHRAGGMLSLTRGFAFAGANSVISSLWEVNEESTTELMDLFYTNLRKGINKSEALRLAKESLLDNGNFNHPYYWAAFIPVGKTQDIGNGYEKYKHLLLYGLGGLLVLFFIYRYRRFHALNH